MNGNKQLKHYIILYIHENPRKIGREEKRRIISDIDKGYNLLELAYRWSFDRWWDTLFTMLYLHNVQDIKEVVKYVIKKANKERS